MSTPAQETPRLDPLAIRDRVHEVCAIGNRFLGSAGEAAARAYMVERFREVGLENVRCEEVLALGYEQRDARCEVVGAGELGEVGATGLQFTASGTAEADAIFVGAPSGAAEVDAFERAVAPIRDRIVVLHTPVPFMLATDLAARGARGIVVVSRNWGGQIGHFTARGYPPPDPSGFERHPLPIPGVAIASADGDAIVAAMTGRSVRLRIRHAADYRPVETANVVGELPGVEEPEERVVLGAHYDTQLAGVGACDNASGMAALVEIARSWRPLRLRRTAVFVSFAGEELGCFGADAYCRRHEDELDDTVGMVNLDALGWLLPAARAIHADAAMLPYARERAAELGWHTQDEQEASLFPGADHNAFIDVGVPACFIWRYPPPHPYYHGEGDTMELLDVDTVTETAQVAAHVALSLAREPELALGRARPAVRWREPAAR